MCNRQKKKWKQCMINTNLLANGCGNLSTRFQNGRFECLYCFLYWKSLRNYQNIDKVSLDLFLLRKWRFFFLSGFFVRCIRLYSEEWLLTILQRRIIVSLQSVDHYFLWRLPVIDDHLQTILHLLLHQQHRDFRKSECLDEVNPLHRNHQDSQSAHDHSQIDLQLTDLVQRMVIHISWVILC